MTDPTDVHAAPGRRARTGSDASAFKYADAGSYDAVASAFDRLTDRYSAPLADRAVELAQLAPGQRVLDVGTGTGVVAVRAAERVGSDGSVTAIDLSSGMLQILVGKNQALPRAKRTAPCRMDAEALAFHPGSFDAVVSLFAVLHFPRPRTALREMHAVIRPGGRIVVAVGSGPPLCSARAWLQRLVRLPELAASARGIHLVAPHFLNDLVQRRLPASGQPEESALARSRDHPARAVPALLREAGFAAVRSSWAGHTATVAEAEDFWTLQATFSTFARKRLAAAPEAEVEQMHAEFLDRCRAVQRRGGKLLFPQAALFVTGHRPPVSSRA